ncbi:hypothetical protein BS47DRAFT_1361257 [Hydnum rufescens UP504]|uniref:Uncharacterized protein n=1 Tax=Hydnum rufescens UP504 TaxID=1448309 RepID=A0A9P6DUB4_9AGAM|nr:hypothetical protein BS47DRAFT_1361257 [Hydnum rufescens UP504]
MAESWEMPTGGGFGGTDRVSEVAADSNGHVVLPGDLLPTNHILMLKVNESGINGLREPFKDMPRRLWLLWKWMGDMTLRNGGAVQSPAWQELGNSFSDVWGPAEFDQCGIAICIYDMSALPSHQQVLAGELEVVCNLHSYEALNAILSSSVEWYGTNNSSKGYNNEGSDNECMKCC